MKAGAAAILELLRLGDSALPIGTFVQSFGLETSIQEGRIRDRSTLEDYLRMELRLRIAPCDLPILGEAYRAAAARNLARVMAADAMAHALKSAQESRLASLQMGRSLLELSLKTTPTPFLRRLAERLKKERGTLAGGHLAVVLGCVGAARGLTAGALAVAYLYGFLSSRLSVAVRLVPMGQTEAQSILVALLPLCETLAPAVNQRPEDISDFSGISEIQMMRHETLETKIFQS